MKIGAGGLQSIITQEASRGIDSNRVRTPSEEVLRQSEDPLVRKQLYDLNKAVERLRRAAETYNHPMDFEIKREARPKKIIARDRRTETSREMTLEDAEEWLEEIENRRGKGRNLNGYA